MRIYNKKRFILGISFTVISLMSIYLLALSIINLNDIFSIIKNIIFSIVLICISFTALKSSTNVDLNNKLNIEEFDERNILIKQKSGESLSRILLYIFIILDLISILFYNQVKSEIYSICVLIFTLLIFIYFILNILITIYYDKKL